MDSGVADVLDTVDHQLLCGRRGTGKTYALSYLASEVRARGDIALSLDLRTIGSPDGILSSTGTPTDRARYARNHRLADAVQQWAFSSMRGSPGARAYYLALRARNIGHQAALRQLANRQVGILHGCLKHRTPYSEQKAWPHHATTAA